MTTVRGMCRHPDTLLFVGGQLTLLDAFSKKVPYERTYPMSLPACDHTCAQPNLPHRLGFASVRLRANPKVHRCGVCRTAVRASQR